MGRFSCIIWWSINANTNILIRRRKREITDRRGEGNVITEAGIGDWSQKSKVSQQLLETRRSQEQNSL